jgi:hypothetical protein
MMRILTTCTVLLLMTTSCAHAGDYSDETMQPLAATAGDLARAVRRYAAINPAEISGIGDQELVQRASAHDPTLLKPYGALVVRARPQGVVLVCSENGRIGLFEDAACTPAVDSIRWRTLTSPCAFEVDPAQVCAK